MKQRWCYGCVVASTGIRGGVIFNHLCFVLCFIPTWSWMIKKPACAKIKVCLCVRGLLLFRILRHPSTWMFVTTVLVFLTCFMCRLYSLEEQLSGTCVTNFLMTVQRLYKMLLCRSEMGQVFMQSRYLYVGAESQDAVVDLNCIFE